MGYLVGALIVLALLPSGIVVLSRLLDRSFGLALELDLPARAAIGTALAAGGLGIGLWSIVIQRTIGQGGPVQIGHLDISPRTGKLVVSGPYRYSRNPMLFGASLAYLGLAVFLGSIFALAIVFAFIMFMLLVVVPSEERRLSRDFGLDYEKYRARTSLFIPWPPKRGTGEPKP